MSTKSESAIPKTFTPGWLDDLDGRYALTRAMRSRFSEIAEDVGGLERLSYIQRSLIERALWLEYWVSEQERALAEGRAEDFDSNRVAQALNTLLGIYRQIGVGRVARDTSLAAYLEAVGAKAKAG